MSVAHVEKDRLVTPREFCDRLGVSERWLRRQIEEGTIVPIKLGRFNRFRESYVEDLMRTGLRVGS